MSNITKKPLTKEGGEKQLMEKNKKFFSLYDQVDGYGEGNKGGKMRAIVHIADYCGVAPMTVKMNWFVFRRIPKRRIDNAIKAVLEVLNKQNQ